MSGPRTALPVTLSTRIGALVTLLAGALALGLAGLLAPQVCLLALLMIVFAGVLVPRWISWLTSGSRQRSGAALVALLLLVLATAASGPGALNTGGLDGALGAAAGELALPSGVPIGLLAALAAGALVAVPLELADRRGVQSALVLGIAVLGLATVAAPGRHLLPALILGWPAVLHTMAGLAAAAPVPGQPPAATAMMNRRPGVGRPAIEGLVRWSLWPVLAAITLSCALVLVAVLAGITKTNPAGRGHGWGALGDRGRTSTSRSSYGYLDGMMDLNARGPLGNEPVFSVPTDSPRLWRSGTLDLYTGRTWLATASSAGLPKFTSVGSGEISLVEVPSALPAQPTRTDQVRPRTGSTQVVSPGQLIRLSSPSLIGGKAFSGGGDRLSVASRSGTLGSYQVTTRTMPDVDDSAVREQLLGSVPSSVDAEGSDPRWTELPAALPSRVRELGLQLVGPAPSRLAAVQAVEVELDRRMTYTLDSPVPADGKDAVDDVLFTSHRGFCEQFASAEVVLLRSAGVPARVAVGFSGGEPADDGFRTVRRSEAHAWVEVWFPGVGWVTSDPTPAAPPAESSTWRDVANRLIDSPLVWAAVLLLGLALGLGIWRQRRRSSLSKPATGRQVDPDLAAAFTRLEADLEARGMGRARHETVAALARRLPADSVRNALTSLERALYAETPPDREECLAAAAAIDRSLLPDRVPESTVRSKGL